MYALSSKGFERDGAIYGKNCSFMILPDMTLLILGSGNGCRSHRSPRLNSPKKRDTRGHSIGGGVSQHERRFGIIESLD